MANRPDDDPYSNPITRAVQARADQVRADREREDQRRIERLQAVQAQIAPRPDTTVDAEPDLPGPPVSATTPYDPAAIAARIDLMRGRFAKARDDVVSALLFLGDAQQDCDALSEACSANRWVLMANGVGILSDALRRALPSEPRQLDLIGLLIDALYALRRAETRPDMGRAGSDLLRGLKLAVNRELPDSRS